MSRDPSALSSMEIPKSARFPVFRGAGEVEYIDKEVPLPDDGEILLRCRANALCASELGMFSRGSDVTPGHEAAGQVVAVGNGVSPPSATR